MPAADSDFHALWMQNLDYPARLDRVFADNIWTAGVLGGSSFEVTPSAPAALTVDVAAGVAVVAGADQTAQGKYLVRKQTPETGLAISAAPGSGQRNDLIVLEVRDPNASGPSGDDVRLLVVEGTPSTSPVDPTPPDTCLVLARVRVPSGTGTITSALIDDLRPQSDFQHPTGTAGLQDDAVTTAKIADGAVTNAKLRNSGARTVIGRAVSTTGSPADIAVNADQVVGRVGSGNVVSTQVQTNMIANGAVTSAKIGTNQVTGSEIADGAVGTTQLASPSVTTAKIADEAVTFSKIAPGSVTSSRIASGGVETGNIANGAVTEAKLQTNTGSLSASSGWTNFNGDLARIGSTVFLDLRATRGSGGTLTITNVPADFRPQFSENRWAAGLFGSNGVQITVATNGNVTVTNPTSIPVGQTLAISTFWKRP
jgi:hypothetical protein